MKGPELPKRSRRLSSFLVADVLLVLFSLVAIEQAMSVKPSPPQEPVTPQAQASEKLDAQECPKPECPEVDCPDKDCSEECKVQDTPEARSSDATQEKARNKGSRQVDQAKISETIERFEIAFAKHIRKKRIEVLRSAKGIILRMPLKKAFQSKKPRFRKSYAKVMRVVRNMLADSSLPIVVSCHTDDQKPPGKHRSNWTYSSSCAGHVARSVLRKDLIVSERLKVQAFAGTRPLEPNTSKAAREKNRRIEIELVFSPAP